MVKAHCRCSWIDIMNKTKVHLSQTMLFVVAVGLRTVSRLQSAFTLSYISHAVYIHMLRVLLQHTSCIASQCRCTMLIDTYRLDCNVTYRLKFLNTMLRMINCVGYTDSNIRLQSGCGNPQKDYVSCVIIYIQRGQIN